MQTFETLDEYIANYTESTQKILQSIRQLIQELAPEAQECISYGMPTFKLKGVLVHFAAFKNHIGLYALPSGNQAFQSQLTPYKTGKGSIQFPLDQAIPYDLIREIVKFRIQENLERKSKKSQTADSQ
ncbi:MAG: DUF1801 domain-containing protein [Microscillaceae bacterium]|jgi:uncharacterized protein YdhG (YjbR/CyaY superfamily)|nr:DUF1801 domain-containing protein [Microscillaceae bacterium]